MARYLGLDEENIVAEYTLAVGDRPTVPVWTGSPPAVTPDQPWLAWIIAAAVILALLAGTWLGARRIPGMARRKPRGAGRGVDCRAIYELDGNCSARHAASRSDTPVAPPQLPMLRAPRSGAPAAAADAGSAAPPASAAATVFELKMEDDQENQGHHRRG